MRSDASSQVLSGLSTAQVLRVVSWEVLYATAVDAARSSQIIEKISDVRLESCPQGQNPSNQSWETWRFNRDSLHQWTTALQDAMSTTIERILQALGRGKMIRRRFRCETWTF
jgi:hypothetical protein